MSLRDLMGDWSDTELPVPEVKARGPVNGYADLSPSGGKVGSGQTTNPDTQSALDETLVLFGYDPEKFQIIGNVRVRAWDSHDGTKLFHHSAEVGIRAEALAFPALSALVADTRVTKRTRPPKDKPKRAVVVAFSDPQVGKVSTRGGFDELLVRVGLCYDALEAYLRSVRPHLGVWVDLGDIVEGFESGGGPLAQHSRNDLSLMAQIDFAKQIEHAGIALTARYAKETIVGGVASNHARWRSGKTDLGRAEDDWGIFIVKQLQQMYSVHKSKALRDIRFVLPKPDEEHIVIDVLGTRFGFAHGHRSRSAEKVGEWWTRMAMAGTSLRDAFRLVVGHFHHDRSYPVGWCPHTKRETRVDIAPTLDNGSDWFSVLGNAESDPGLLVFTVEEGRGIIDRRVLIPEGVAA